MSTYTVIDGDTFEKIARKVYGEESRAESIKQANPSVVTLRAGVVLYIADVRLLGTPKVLANDVDEVALTIDGQTFKYWLDFLIEDHIDTFDTFEFTAPFLPENLAFRETFAPMSFKTVTLTIGGERKFTGTIIDVMPESDAEKSTVKVSCYSTAAAINDCTVSFATFPVEFEKQNVVDIARKLVEPHGFTVIVNGDAGPVFKRVALESNQTILDFLITLAKQRAVLITNGPAGECRFFKATAPGNPVARLREGQAGVISVTPQFQGQKFYTDYTGIQGKEVSYNDAKYTVKNPHLTSGYRPIVFKLPDTTTGDLKTAVEAEAARMIASVVGYTVVLASWRDPNGQLWQSNTTITLVAPNAMVYDEFEFLIRSVVLDKDAQGQNATLELVIPGTYSGTMPERLPWQAAQ